MMVVLKLKFSVVSFLSLPRSIIPILVLASSSLNRSQNSLSNAFRLQLLIFSASGCFFFSSTEFDQPWPHLPSCLSKANIFAGSSSSFLARCPALPSLDSTSITFASGSFYNLQTTNRNLCCDPEPIRRWWYFLLLLRNTCVTGGVRRSATEGSRTPGGYVRLEPQTSGVAHLIQ